MRGPRVVVEGQTVLVGGARSKLVVVRNSMGVRLGRICPYWKSMAGVVPTKKEATTFRSELVAGIRDEFPRQFEKARLKAEGGRKGSWKKGKEKWVRIGPRELEDRWWSTLCQSTIDVVA